MPYPAPAGNLTRGGLDTTSLTVQITFGAACSNVTATVSLPSGVTYVPGSVVKTGGLAGSGITYTGSSLTAPVFAISGITSAGDITFAIRRTAQCGVTGAGKDNITVTGSCGSFTENNPNVNSYTIFAPSLSLSAPAAITAASVGNSYVRTTVLTNGGNGSLDTVSYYVVLPSGRISMADSPANTITATMTGFPSVSFTPVRTSGDTLFYNIYGTNVFGADNLLSNGEVVNITENVTARTCGSFTSYYGARWGRNGSYCQLVTGSSVLTTATTAATLSNGTGMTPALSGCVAPVLSVKDSMTNTGVAIVYKSLTIIPAASNPNVYIDTASIMVSIAGGALAHPAGGLTVTGTNTSSFAGLNGKPVRVYYRLPSEVAFPNGAKAIVSYNLISDVRDTVSCGAGNVATTFAVTHTYRLVCNAATDTLNKASGNITSGYAASVSSFSVQTPAVVPNNGIFTMKIPVTFNLPASPVFPKRYGEVTLTVPSGVDLVSAQDIIDTSSNIYTSISGNQITFRFIPNVTTKSNYVYFRLRNTSACGYQSITTRVMVVLDSSCAPGSRLQATQCVTSAQIKFRCPPSGGSGSCPGVSGPDFTFARTSFGLPDNDQDGKPDASGSLNAAKIDPDRYMVGDTLHSVSSGIVTGRGISTPDSFAYVYAEWNFPTGNWTPAGPATVTIRRGGNTYTCSNVTVSTITANKYFRADWKSNSCMSGLVSYRTGDSISVVANFRLGDAYVNGASEIGGKNGSVYTDAAMATCRVVHLLYASGAANPPTGGNIGGTGSSAGYACDTALYNAYLTGWKHVIGSNAVTPAGCAAATKNFTLTTTTFGSQYFTAEYRPIAIPDTCLVFLPQGWDYTGIPAGNCTMSYTVKRGSPATVSFSITPVVTTNAGVTQLLFDYAAALHNASLPFVGTEALTFTTNYNVKPSSCLTATSAKDSVVEIGHLASPFNLGSGRYVISSATGNTLRYTNRPALTVTNSTGTITANTPLNSWDIQVAANANASPNVWVAFEKGSGTVTVDSVAYLNAGGTATTGLATAAASYGTGKTWYQLATAIAANSNQKLRVYFRYGNCVQDSIKVIAGYDCSGFPSSPDAVSCAVSPVSAPLYLKVLSRPSEIQLSILRQPGNGSPISLCATDSVIFIVNSAQPANITSPKLQIINPNGLSINTPIAVEYPLNSGNWQNLTPAVISGGYELDLSQHTAIGLNGMKGTVANAASAGRQAKVRVTYTTGCSYRSGSNLILNGFANGICGSPAVGDGTNVKTDPLNIIGIPTGGGTINMAMSLPTATLNCGNMTTLSLTSTPLGGATQPNDSVIYTLPAGVAYGGNFVPGANCVGCTVSTAPGALAGTTYVKVRIPEGVANNTNIAYSFDISGTGGGCGASTIDATAVRTYPGIYCGATLCTASTKVVGNTASGTINRVRPDILPTNITLLNGGYFPGSQNSFKVDFQNNGGQDASGDVYKVEFLCTGAAAPIYTGTLRKAVAMSGSASDTFSFAIPAACATGGNISVRVAPVTAGNVSQCLCAARSAFYTGTPLPVELVQFSAVKKGQLVVTSWEVRAEGRIAGYEVERSTDAVFFSAIAKVSTAAGNNGSYEQQDANLPAAGALYYRLRMNYANGTYGYSNTVKLVFSQSGSGLVAQPNPVSSLLHLSWNSQTAGTAVLRVLNAVGNTMFTKRISAVAGANQADLAEVSGLAPGTYLLQLIAGQQQLEHIRFEVLR